MKCPNCDDKECLYRLMGYCTSRTDEDKVEEDEQVEAQIDEAIGRQYHSHR